MADLAQACVSQFDCILSDKVLPFGLCDAEVLEGIGMKYLDF